MSCISCCTDVDLNQFVKNTFAKITRSPPSDYYYPLNSRKFTLSRSELAMVAKEFKIMKNAIFEHIATVLSMSVSEVRNIVLPILQDRHYFRFDNHMENIYGALANIVHNFDAKKFGDSLAHGYAFPDEDHITMLRIFKPNFSSRTRNYLQQKNGHDVSKPYGFMGRTELFGSYMIDNRNMQQSQWNCERIITAIDKEYLLVKSLSDTEREYFEFAKYIIELTYAFRQIEMNMKWLASVIVAEITSRNVANKLYGYHLWQVAYNTYHESHDESHSENFPMHALHKKLEDFNMYLLCDDDNVTRQHKVEQFTVELVSENITNSIIVEII